MPDNKALFSAITKGYTKYSQKLTQQPQLDAATQSFISILNANNVYLDDNAETDNQFTNMQPLKSYSRGLTIEQEKNIATALSVYCFAGGGPLYDAIKSELKIEHNIDLLDAPIVIENLDKQAAIKFLENSWEKAASIDHSSIWLFFLLNEILEPHTIINHHTFMTYWNEQHNPDRNFAATMQDFHNHFDSLFKQPYTELHGQILSQPFMRRQTGTRLQEAATVCQNTAFGQTAREQAKDILVKMLKIPGIHIKEEVGRSWIETLLFDVSAEYFTEVLDAIPASMLQEFYDNGLYLKIANDMGDIWTIAPVQQVQYRQKCSLLLKILNTVALDSETQKLKTKLEKLKELTDALEFVTLNETQKQDDFFTKIKNFVKGDLEISSPRYHYFSQLKNIDRISTEKVHLKIAYFINNTVLHLVKSIATERNEDMYCRGISSFVKDINESMTLTNKTPLVEDAASYIYQSIEQSLSLLNTKNTINQITPKMVNDFSALIEALEIFLDKFAIFKIIDGDDTSTSRDVNFLNIDDMLKNNGIKQALTNALKKTTLASGTDQMKNTNDKIKKNKFYIKIFETDPFEGAEKNLQGTLRNVGNIILNHWDSSYLLYKDYSKGIYVPKAATHKEFFILEITENLKLIATFIDFTDRLKITSLTSWLEFILNDRSLIITDFEESIQIIYARLQLEVKPTDDNAEFTTLKEQHHTFMRQIQHFSSQYKWGVTNILKSYANSGESMRCAEFLAALPYENKDDSTKKSSLFKAILQLISYRLTSYQSDSHRKSFYHENLKPAFEKLDPISLSDMHKKIILFEIERALNVPDLILGQNDDRLQLLAKDLGFFIKTFGLDIIKVREILHKSKLYTLSGASPTSTLDNTIAYGRIMQAAASGQSLELSITNNSTTLNRNNF